MQDLLLAMLLGFASLYCRSSDVDGFCDYGESNKSYP
jgi:hypothetical protein